MYMTHKHSYNWILVNVALCGLVSSQHDIQSVKLLGQHVFRHWSQVRDPAIQRSDEISRGPFRDKSDRNNKQTPYG